MIIKKRTDMKFFQHVLDSRKKFDVRLADFECKAGDTLVLEEFDMKNRELTGRVIQKKVKYVLKTKDLPYWTKKEADKFGYQVISFD